MAGPFAMSAGTARLGTEGVKIARKQVEILKKTRPSRWSGALSRTAKPGKGFRFISRTV
jgi:hypothetical protein